MGTLRHSLRVAECVVPEIAPGDYSGVFEPVPRRADLTAVATLREA